MRGGRGGIFGATEESTAVGVQRAKWRDPAQRVGAASTHQPERLVWSQARVGGSYELRLRLQSSDPRERTGVGCVNTA